MDWIPVEKRLPRNGDSVLVTAVSTIEQDIEIAMTQCAVRISTGWQIFDPHEVYEVYDSGGDDVCIDDDIRVTAWMPLPLPHK